MLYTILLIVAKTNNTNSEIDLLNLVKLGMTCEPTL